MATDTTFRRGGNSATPRLGGTNAIWKGTIVSAAGILDASGGPPTEVTLYECPAGKIAIPLNGIFIAWVAGTGLQIEYRLSLSGANPITFRTLTSSVNSQGRVNLGGFILLPGQRISAQENSNSSTSYSTATFAEFTLSECPVPNQYLIHEDMTTVRKLISTQNLTPAIPQTNIQLPFYSAGVVGIGAGYFKVHRVAAAGSASAANQVGGNDNETLLKYLVSGHLGDPLNPGRTEGSGDGVINCVPCSILTSGQEMHMVTTYITPPYGRVNALMFGVPT